MVRTFWHHVHVSFLELLTNVRVLFVKGRPRAKVARTEVVLLHISGFNNFSILCRRENAKCSTSIFLQISIRPSESVHPLQFLHTSLAHRKLDSSSWALLAFQGTAMTNNALLQVAARQAGGEQCDESAYDASYEHTLWHLWHLHVQRNQVQHAQGGCGGRELPRHPGFQVSLAPCLFGSQRRRLVASQCSANSNPWYVSLRLCVVTGSTSGVRHVRRRSL